MRPLPALVAAMAALAPAAASADPPASVAPLIGNTIEIRYGKAVMTTSIAADGTFKMRLPDGTRTSGDWVADARYLCWITKAPALPAGRKFRCETIASGKSVGDTWTQVDAFGDEAEVTLLAGDRL